VSRPCSSRPCAVPCTPSCGGAHRPACRGIRAASGPSSLSSGRPPTASVRPSPDPPL
jgi:hypothetical protein